MKFQANKKRRHVEFNIGDLVLVKLQPYHQSFLALRKHQKLGLRYFGPFPITAKVGTIAYRLEFQTSSWRIVRKSLNFTPLGSNPIGELTDPTHKTTTLEYKVHKTPIT